MNSLVKFRWLGNSLQCMQCYEIVEAYEKVTDDIAVKINVLMKIDNPQWETVPHAELGVTMPEFANVN